MTDVRYRAFESSAVNGRVTQHGAPHDFERNATGFVGVQRGMQGLQREANKIARSANDGFDTVDIAASLVTAQSHRRSIEANLRVIEHADRALGRRERV